MKNFRLVLWVLVAFSLTAYVGFSYLSNDYGPRVIMDPTPEDIRGYTLTSHEGKTVSHRDFAGQYTLIYFGYSFCPSFCPTDLARMSTAMRMLERDGINTDFIQPIFITIDPHRDTVEQMADTVDLYHPKLLGLTGTEAEIREIADRFQIIYHKVGDPNADADYLMDHMNLIFLMDGESRRINMFGQQDSAADIAAILTEISESIQ